MLQVVTAWSSDQLADWLGDWLAGGPTDPFARELVVVPTPGLERYLTRRFARRWGTSGGAGGGGTTSDGVCAGVDFLHPDELLAKVAAATVGDGDDPWDAQQLQWHCLAALDELVEDTARWSTGLRHYLREDGRDARRLPLAREAAGLLTNYAVQRPELIESWSAGSIGQVPAHCEWQYHLFRRVLDATGAEPWPVRLRHALRDGVGDVAGLPSRLAVFGATRFGELETTCLRALAQRRDIAVLMVRHTAEGPHANRLVASFAQEESHGAAALAALGAGHRELSRITQGPGGLLGRLQQAIAADRELTTVERAPQPGDTSLTVHGCAGDLRQVEVLRDQLLHLLADDPTVQPRDVLIMSTDLARHAPLIAQVLGTESAPVAGPTRDLRVRIADRVARIDNPVLQVVASFTRLLTTRMTATEVLDFVELPPVAQRFGLDADDHSRIERLVRTAAIRWGLGPEHRAAFDTPVPVANTWQAGLDRLALGLAVDGREADLVGGVAPMEAAGDDDVRRVAALAAVVDTLGEAWEYARLERPAAAWAAAICGWLDALADGAEPWQIPSAKAVVSQVLDSRQPLAAREVVALLDDELSRYAPLPDLQAGGVAVAAMRPMRNIPFRVICLLGMDDGAFPRSVALGGNDLLAADPHPGEREPRTEDRQLFLDAICAATQHLVITYSSRNPLSGASLPPAAPLAELLDAVGDVVQHHPLSAYDLRNFDPGPATGGRPASHDAAAAAVACRTANHPTLLRDIALEPDSADTTLDELLDFWKSPGKAFLRRLRLPIQRDSDQIDDELRLDLDGLAKWGIGDALLRATRPRDAAMAVDLARGALPVHDAETGWTGTAAIAEALTAAAAPYRAGDTDLVRIDISLDLPDHAAPQGRLTGVVPVSGSGVLLDVSFSSWKAEHQLALRIQIAALAAMGRPLHGVLIRRQADKARVEELAAPSQDEALKWLRFLARLRWRGLSRPLPFAPETSCAYAHGGPDDREALVAADKEWTRRFNSPVPGEGDKPEHTWLWDGDLDVLRDVPPWPEWTDHAAERSLFAQLAKFAFGEPPR